MGQYWYVVIIFKLFSLDNSAEQAVSPIIQMRKQGLEYGKELQAIRILKFFEGFAFVLCGMRDLVETEWWMEMPSVSDRKTGRDGLRKSRFVGMNMIFRVWGKIQISWHIRFRCVTTYILPSIGFIIGPSRHWYLTPKLICPPQSQTKAKQEAECMVDPSSHSRTAHISVTLV